MRTPAHSSRQEVKQSIILYIDSPFEMLEFEHTFFQTNFMFKNLFLEVIFCLFLNHQMLE